ncbi:MAG: family 43 glycosylhydrolase [Oscillospiraceae bacterium]|nr:family 43 glycosylhydrolase [Oscillospiraceae bacterium]
MKTNEINIRDPFVLPFEGKYYMYGTRGWNCTGFDAYVSEDLENWEKIPSVFEKPEDFWATENYWAPEVHYYNGKFYMFASFKDPAYTRATQILVADRPEGPFTVHSKRITPDDWECLDGTLYVEDGVPYMVFCHEWVQVRNGEVRAVELEKDLSRAKGEPFLLWTGKDAPWVTCYDGKEGDYVTDGPFFFRGRDGRLCFLWSSFGEEGYATGIAYSDDNTIRGKWLQKEETVFKKDGGHAMIFETFDGKRMISLHSPNSALDERPVFLPFVF